MTDSLSGGQASDITSEEEIYDSSVTLPGEKNRESTTSKVLVVFVDDIYDHQMSPMTFDRLNRAYVLWKTDYYDRIYVVGGMIHSWNKQSETAATIMEDWLMSAGVPHDAILTDGSSTNIFQAVRESFAKLTFASSRGRLSENYQLTICSDWQQCLYVWALYRFGYGVSVRVALVKEPTQSWKSWFSRFKRIYHTFRTAIPEARRLNTWKE